MSGLDLTTIHKIKSANLIQTSSVKFLAFTQSPKVTFFYPKAAGYENEHENFRVVALGTGSKCIGRNKLNKEGI